MAVKTIAEWLELYRNAKPEELVMLRDEIEENFYTFDEAQRNAEIEGWEISWARENKIAYEKGYKEGKNEKQ